MFSLMRWDARFSKHALDTPTCSTATIESNDSVSTDRLFSESTVVRHTSTCSNVDCPLRLVFLQFDHPLECEERWSEMP